MAQRYVTFPAIRRVTGAQLGRQARLTRSGFVVVAALLFAACSGGSNESTESGATIEKSTTSEESTTSTVTTTTPPTTESDTQAPDLDEFYDLVSRTAAQPRVSFELSVKATTFPGAYSVSFSTGSVDADKTMAVGSHWVERGVSTVQTRVKEPKFEYRRVADTFWIYDPVSDPSVWIGLNYDEFNESSNHQIFSAIDGGSILTFLAEVTSELVDVVEESDGTTTWSLLVQPNDLLSILSSSDSVLNRIGEESSVDSEMFASVKVTVDSDRYVSGFSISLDEWWSGLLLLAPGPPSDGGSMTIEFTLVSFDAALDPEAPCDAPALGTDSEGLEILICDA